MLCANSHIFSTEKEIQWNTIREKINRLNRCSSRSQYLNSFGMMKQTSWRRAIRRNGKYVQYARWKCMWRSRNMSNPFFHLIIKLPVEMAPHSASNISRPNLTCATTSDNDKCKRKEKTMAHSVYRKVARSAFDTQNSFNCRMLSWYLNLLRW